jgi:hypothetical protein
VKALLLREDNVSLNQIEDGRRRHWRSIETSHYQLAFD